MLFYYDTKALTIRPLSYFSASLRARPVTITMSRGFIPSRVNRHHLSRLRKSEPQTKAYNISFTRREHMADIERVSAQQAHAKIKASQALLVCAYEDEAKCRKLNLEGSISFASLQSRTASLPKTQEIIFY